MLSRIFLFYPVFFSWFSFFVDGYLVLKSGFLFSQRSADIKRNERMPGKAGEALGTGY
jgi:hypothetical protein